MKSRSKLSTALRRRLVIPPENPDYRQEPPLFIIGCMRSGTTLLFESLTEHPQLLRVGFELRSVWTEFGGAPCSRDCGYRSAGDVTFAATGAMATYFGRYIERANSWLGLFGRLYSRWVRGSGGIWKDFSRIHPVNKSTHLMNKVSYLHEMFPGAKIILIIRSIEGQVNSLSLHFERLKRERGDVFLLPEDNRGCWSLRSATELTPNEMKRTGTDNAKLLAEAWIRLNHLALTELDALPSNLCQLVSYESLVREPRRVFGELFDFLNLDPKYRSAEYTIAGRPRKLFNSLTQNPLTSWQKRLSDIELGDIQQATSENHDRYDAILKRIGKVN